VPLFVKSIESPVPVPAVVLGDDIDIIKYRSSVIDT